MSGFQRSFADDVIKTYFEMGCAALDKAEYTIAQKMFKAVFEEPSSKLQKENIMLPLLLKSAQAHEGMRQLYKAKLLYIRALALLKKQNPNASSETIEILLVLARINAQQAIYRQAVEFAVEAFHVYGKTQNKDSISFVRGLKQTQQIMELKGRTAEKEKLQQMIEAAKIEAISPISVMVPAFSASVPF